MSSTQPTIAVRYEEAISALNSLQTNQSILKSTDRQGKSVRDVERYLSLLNVQSEHLDKLNIIHVAGTKGKGSTCALVESMLRQYGYRTGFFSSPHLVEARERIRLDGELISKEKFVHYFWECYRPISDAVKQSKDEDPLPMPFYFAFLTTMMFYVFVHEKIDVAVVEVGIGGEYDCTNVIKKPIVCGVTSLGLDHMKLLGNTIDKIAWQKAGIFKKSVPAVTVPQPAEAMKVLFERAEEREVRSLIVAPPLKNYSNYPFRLSLAGDIQEINAAIALQLVFHWLSARGVRSYEELMNAPLSDELLRGLSTCRWAGRNQVMETENATYYIDGAHTVESIEQCQDWFLRCLVKQPARTDNLLIFYCSNDREPETLLRVLAKCRFDHVLFCSPVASLPSSTDEVKTGQDQWRAKQSLSEEMMRLSLHETAYEKLLNDSADDKRPSIHCFPSVSRALSWIDQNQSSKPSVLVTGSLYLVGAFLKVFQERSHDEN